MPALPWPLEEPARYVLAIRLHQGEQFAAGPASPTSTLLGAGRPGLQGGTKRSLLVHTEAPKPCPPEFPFLLPKQLCQNIVFFSLLHIVPLGLA